MVSDGPSGDAEEMDALSWGSKVDRTEEGADPETTEGDDASWIPDSEVGPAKSNDGQPADSIEGDSEDSNGRHSPTAPPSGHRASGKISIEDYDIKSEISRLLGESYWPVVETVLSAHSTLLIDGIIASQTMVIEGPPSTGKTTILKLLQDLDHQFYRSDEITPSAFVSMDPSKKSDDLEDTDLLPRLEKKTLLISGLEPLLRGKMEAIADRWSTLSKVLDGEGMWRDSATHGRRGYDEARFNFVAATTPLSPRSWRAMGQVGPRLLLVESPGRSVDEWWESQQEIEYSEILERGRSVVHEFLGDLWTHHGGAGSIDWGAKTGDESVRAAVKYLNSLVRHARRPVYEESEPGHLEGPDRIGNMLLNLARGHAILYGRTEVTMEDLRPSARAALTTMPQKRRELLRLLLDPDTPEQLTASDVVSILDVSKPTARKRMGLIATTGIADMVELNDGRATKSIKLKLEFEWPTGLKFPKFNR